MKVIKGTFNYARDLPGFDEIAQAMKALRQARRNTAKDGYEYIDLTHKAGHSDSFPGILTKDTWNYGPQKLTFNMVSSCTRDRRTVGAITVYDSAPDAPMTFEMDEKLFKSAQKQLAKTNVATLTPLER